MKLWEKRNPFPEGRWSTPEELAAIKIRESALAGRYENAMRQSGAGGHRKLRNLAHAQYTQLLQRIADTPAVTRLDRQAKAKLTSFEAADGPIRAALIRELRA